MATLPLPELDGSERKNILDAADQLLDQNLLDVIEAALAKRLTRQVELIVALVGEGRDANLSSPDLDPAWIAGWRAATDHHAATIASVLVDDPATDPEPERT